MKLVALAKLFAQYAEAFPDAEVGRIILTKPEDEHAIKNLVEIYRNHFFISDFSDDRKFIDELIDIYRREDA